jgi:hypothetical protein
LSSFFCAKKSEKKQDSGTSQYKWIKVDGNTLFTNVVKPSPNKIKQLYSKSDGLMKMKYIAGYVKVSKRQMFVAFVYKIGWTIS